MAVMLVSDVGEAKEDGVMKIRYLISVDAAGKFTSLQGANWANEFEASNWLSSSW